MVLFVLTSAAPLGDVVGDDDGDDAAVRSRWRTGWSGALRLGLAHGFYCVGCCWALMLLLFAGGVMNVVVIAGLAVWVAFEKLAPFGRRGALVSGAVTIAVGRGY